MKTLEQHFIDWESNTFGFGYGTGEVPVLRALKQFLALCCRGTLSHAYEHAELSVALTPTVAWLLINTLCRADVVEYGTSPRYGWLTKKGEALARFVAERTAERLAELTFRNENYIHCAPEYCNCDDGDCRPNNPFWTERG
jgi:hypothetical protein